MAERATIGRPLCRICCVVRDRAQDAVANESVGDSSRQAVPVRRAL